MYGPAGRPRRKEFLSEGMGNSCACKGCQSTAERGEGFFRAFGHPVRSIGRSFEQGRRERRRGKGPPVAARAGGGPAETEGKRNQSRETG